MFLPRQLGTRLGASDLAAGPAPISAGTLPTGGVVSYARREAARFVGICWLVGALLGAVVSVVRGRHA